MMTLRNLSLAFSLVLSLSACMHQAETGKSVLLLTSPSFENNLGSEGYRDVLSKEKVNSDPRLNAILQRVGKAIAAQANRPDFKWEFTLIESEQQNAWCMPGGKVAVYTGILPMMANEAGMAAVMGHEVAHAVLRHSGQRISQQMILGAGLKATEISLGNNSQKDMIMGLLGAGATVGVMLPYSRGHETESDLLGLEYMAKAGYNPQEAVQFWERFGKNGGAPPEFLSTHPGANTRVRDLKAKMPEAMRYYEAAAKKYGLGEKL